jgi:L-fuconolactonase
MRIDAHQHFWHYQPETHGWISDEMRVLRKDFTPEELKTVLADFSFDGSVVVQANETYDENDFLLDIAQKHNYIKGIVGWIDLLDPQAEVKMVAIKSTPAIVGFRTIMQGSPDEKYLGNKLFYENVKRLATFDYTFDLLVHNNQLDSLIRFTDKLPDNRFILDHLGKPAIKNKEYKEWKTEIKILAANPNMYCKLSGMITEADLKNWTYNDLYPYMEIAAEYFGLDRICFGSDWPVCLAAGSFATTYSVVDQFCGQLKQEEKDKIFGLNTKDFYKL